MSDAAPSRLERVLAFTDAPSALRLALRVLFAAALCGTLWITRPLWGPHTDPPTLPLLALPELPWFALLHAAVLVAAVRPREGLALFALVLFPAVLADQTRMQPQLLSLALLLGSTARAPGFTLVARGHLVSLWFWAGINKLLSPTFVATGGAWMVQGLMRRPPVWLERRSGLLIALGEMLVGLLCLAPWTRRLGGVGALGMHLGILAVLGPWGHRWNHSVWPWNAALALAGLALFAAREPSHGALLRGSGWPARALAAALLLAPLGWYFGVVPSYLAHHLYSEDIPSVTSCHSDFLCEEDAVTMRAFETLRVPLPPEPGLLREAFERTCRRGDTATLRDQRRWMRARGRGELRLRCERPTEQGAP